MKYKNKTSIFKAKSLLDLIRNEHNSAIYKSIDNDYYLVTKYGCISLFSSYFLLVRCYTNNSFTSILDKIEPRYDQLSDNNFNCYLIPLFVFDDIISKYLIKRRLSRKQLNKLTNSLDFKLRRYEID